MVRSSSSATPAASAPTCSRSCPTTVTRWCGSMVCAAYSACASMLRPASGCSTLGFFDRILVPAPAASTMTAVCSCMYLPRADDGRRARELLRRQDPNCPDRIGTERGISRAYEEAAMGKDYPLDDGPLSRCTGAERISLAGGRGRRSRRRRVRAHACGHDRENPGGRLEYWTFELVIPTRVAVPSPFGRYTGPPESPTRIPVYPSQRVPLRCPHLHRAPS